ncbi:MAG: hypothetical protein ACLGH0_11685 [Thermoanaerobaculia bacterium]
MKTILVIGDEPLAETLRGFFDVRSPASCADRAAIRAAVRGCTGVVASADDPEHARNVLWVVAGADVDHLVFRSADRELEAYANTLGISSTFTTAADADTVARMFA